MDTTRSAIGTDDAASGPARANDAPPAPLGTRWLTQGFESLLAECAVDATRSDFDVLIVGTGYGGAVAARELAARASAGARVAMLERGSERLPGTFPARFADLAGDVRFTTPTSRSARGEREGLFDVRVGPDVAVLVANGVGGGSLINAGVMELPEPSVFDDPRWPAALLGQYAQVQALGGELLEALGPLRRIDDSAAAEPAKVGVMKTLAGTDRFVRTPITVAISDAPKFTTAAGIRVDRCIGCGDCATGCNHNAKLSLDATLLAQARRAGATIYAGATVLRLRPLRNEPNGMRWELDVVHTNEDLRRRQGPAQKLRARCVVLAAGTLGSTEILMRSRSELALSATLGTRFSANGDMIAAAHDVKVTVNGANNEETALPKFDAAGRSGATILSMIDLRAKGGGVVQDMSVPGPLRWIWEQTVTTAAALDALKEADERDFGTAADVDAPDPCAVDTGVMQRSLLVAMMGRDSASGTLVLPGDGRWDDGDGALGVSWTHLKDEPEIAARQAALEQRLGSSGLGGRVLPNPLWKLMPDTLGFLFDGGKGPLITVHPLGGCPMADDVAQGVVDHCGRVFDAARPGELHDGLAVLDGSIIPVSLGINPSLAISSLALRAARELALDWHCTGTGGSTALPGDRPVYRRMGDPAPVTKTSVELIERLSGFMTVNGLTVDTQPVTAPVWVELTMRFDPVEIESLASSKRGAQLKLDAAHGFMRIFKDMPDQDRDTFDAEALVVAPMSGTLEAFQHEPSTTLQRRWRGLKAWFVNRGLRDTVQWLQERSSDAPASPGAGGLDRLVAAWRLATRAGDRRLLSYALTVGPISSLGIGVTLRKADFEGHAITGTKTFTYSRRSNPWVQLSTLDVDRFPQLGKPDALLLDTGFLARQGVPLLRLVGQQDQPGALRDLGSLLLFLTRMTLHVHAWSFRAPDRPDPRKPVPPKPVRLPGDIPGLPAHESKPFPVRFAADGSPDVHILLTRYKGKHADKGVPGRDGLPLPVLLIHGYSVSGTTFTHPAVQPNFAKFLWDQGRDVWVVDLRTSSGLDTATIAWSFEDVAGADIPVAIDEVLKATQADKIDVFAHCMGSAMLSMALLGDEPNPRPWWPRTQSLDACVNSLALSQVPPAMIFTPANVFRAFMMRTLQTFLPLSDYQFRNDNPKLIDQVIDRLLATLPYPAKEFDFENPFWPPGKRTPWVGTRHRMDALYGRDFNVENVPEGVLDAIDDLFGPLSIKTVSQTIHFATDRTVTNAQGFNAYVTPANLRRVFGHIPLFSVHGSQNGLSDVQSVTHWHRTLMDCDKRFESPQAFEAMILEGYGHQDCLVGYRSAEVFERVHGFFERNAPAATAIQPAPASAERLNFSAVVASHGLRLDPGRGYTFGDASGRGSPFAVMYLRARKVLGQYLPIDKDGSPVDDRTKWPALIYLAQLNRIGSDDEGRLSFDLEHDVTVATPSADGILVLVVYLQSHEIGEPPVMPVGALPTTIASFHDPMPGDGFMDALGDIVLPPPFVFVPDPSLLSTIKILRDMELAAIAAAAAVGQFSAALAEAAFEAFDHIGSNTMDMALLPGKSTGTSAANAPRTFACASCQYPGGLLDRTPPGAAAKAPPGPADASLQWLRGRLDGVNVAGDPPPVPEEVLLLGDQIYADATAGLFDPRVPDARLRLSYEGFLGARGPRLLLARLPTTMRLDDHEIVDNWEPDPPEASPRPLGSSTQDLRKDGLRAYVQWQCDKDPTIPPLPEQCSTWDSGSKLVGYPVFHADARSQRVARTASTIAESSILGDDQARDLDDWLRSEGNAHLCFVTSASMVLPRRRVAADPLASTIALHIDSWDGYPASRNRLLAAIHAHGDGVILLSGDEHVSNFTRITIRKKDETSGVSATSIHASALYAPWPFANSTRDDFIDDETFEFVHPGPAGDEHYVCDVRVERPKDGDGYALLTVSERGAMGRHVSVRFDGPTRERACGNTFEIVVPPQPAGSGSTP